MWWFLRTQRNPTGTVQEDARLRAAVKRRTRSRSVTGCSLPGASPVQRPLGRLVKGPPRLEETPSPSDEVSEDPTQSQTYTKIMTGSDLW
jgi:hypothetical protein